MANLDFVTTDAGRLYDELITAAEEGSNEPLYPGDERRIFAETELAILVQLYNAINDAAEQSMLDYARGTVLDAIGARLGVTRLGGTAATCTLRFTLSAVRDVDTLVPKWTKATADSEVYFATDADAVIPAGELSVDAPATCTGTGDLGNGYPAGTVSTIVDLVPYVQSVANLDETAGGDDGETYDEAGDDRFRERIRLAPERLSVAGPEMAYVYWAETADPSIIDVAAISETETIERELEVVDGRAFMGGDQLLPQDGVTVDGEAEGFTWEFGDSLLTISLGEGLRERETVKVRVRHNMDGRVRIVPLMEGGTAPTEETIRRIYETVNARDVRPMTDVVTVEPPREVEYGIRMTYWVTPEDEGAVMRAVEGEGGAVETYVAQQSSRLGRDVNPDVLRTLVMDAGAIRVDVEEPVYTAVEAGEVAMLTGRPEVSHTLETRARWEDE